MDALRADHISEKQDLISEEHFFGIEIEFIASQGIKDSP